MPIFNRPKLRKTTIGSLPIATRQVSQLKPTSLHQTRGDSVIFQFLVIIGVSARAPIIAAIRIKPYRHIKSVKFKCITNGLATPRKPAKVHDAVLIAPAIDITFMSIFVKGSLANFSNTTK